MRYAGSTEAGHCEADSVASGWNTILLGVEVSGAEQLRDAGSESDHEPNERQQGILFGRA